MWESHQTLCYNYDVVLWGSGSLDFAIHTCFSLLYYYVSTSSTSYSSWLANGGSIKRREDIGYWGSSKGNYAQEDMAYAYIFLVFDFSNPGRYQPVRRIVVMAMELGRERQRWRRRQCEEEKWCNGTLCYASEAQQAGRLWIERNTKVKSDFKWENC